ncbi:Accelerated cell death 11 [Dichanthelium oligosanthes]|uniref:Accelerated cell death 11 n=1 Tax=Dichanthelium oligosanthes TaxID=888268 RepID=A0A1E5VEA8_9POAL|nr:Accelerated cell death 11 [Dichanthelium oligosanthes]
MGSSEAEKPLRRIAASFEELAAVAKQQPPGAMDVGAFSRACSNVSVLFGCLGIAFKFAEIDYVAKAPPLPLLPLVSALYGCTSGFSAGIAVLIKLFGVDDLLEASKSISTLPSMVELDIQKDTVRIAGSHTRNLLRVKRGVDMVKVLFEKMLVTEGNSLRDAASVAYAQVFAPHHGWAIRKAVAAGMYALPSKSQLLKKLNEDEESAKTQIQNFVRSAAPVIRYVEDLFTSRN